MFNEFLQKLPTLMKEKEPDLTKLLNPTLKPLGVTINKTAIVKSLTVKLDTMYQQGSGLASLSGQIVLSLKDGIDVTVVGNPTVNLLVNKTVTLTISKSGLSKIEGIKVDGPSIIDIPITSALIDGDFINLKVGPTTQRIPLPKTK